MKDREVSFRDFSISYFVFNLETIMDDIRFKIFDFDEDRYVFDVEDFEIFKIENKQKTSSILKNIAIAKKENREQLTEGFRDESLSLLSKDNIFIISVDLAHGCTLNCKYCYLSAAENKKQLLTEGRFIDILDFFSDHKKQPLIFYFAGGGEPTLNFELIKKFRNYVQKEDLTNAISKLQQTVLF